MVKSDREILKERAVRNALIIKESGGSMAEPADTLEFTLLKQRFAIESRYASEVHFIREITPIPGAPSFVSGVIIHRGRIVSLINLRTLFKMKERGLTELNKFIIISNKDNYFGIIADSITGILKKDLAEVMPPPDTIEQHLSAYITGIFPDGVIMLDAEKLLTSQEIIIK
jgi:purine-binding chemotaxis protein CheW